MMKIIDQSLLFLALVAGLSSCGGSEPEAMPENPVISAQVSESGTDVPSSGGEARIAYSVKNPSDDGELTAFVSPSVEWISDLRVSSSAVVFQVDENTGDERTADIKLSYPKAQSVTVRLRQLAAGENISLSMAEADVKASGEKVDVTVTSDRSWSLSGGETWVKASSESGESGDIVAFDVAKNESSDSRTATFKFMCGSNEISFVVKQSGVSIGDLIKDETLRDLLASADTDGDGKISSSEAEDVKTLEYTNESGKPIKSLDGLEHFTGLETVVLKGNEFTELNFAGRTSLKSLDVSENASLASIDLNGCRNLTEVSASFNGAMESVDLGGCSSLVSYTGYATGLKAIDVKDCRSLESLTAYSCKMESLDVSACTSLTNLNAGCETLTSVVLPEKSKIESLSLSGSKNLASLDLSRLPSVRSLDVSYAPFKSLDVAKCPLLETLTINFCKKITSLDVSKNLHLKSISATQTNLSKVIMFTGQWGNIKDACFGINSSIITYVDIDYPEDCSSFVSDSGLRQYLLSKYDVDGDGKISGVEAENVAEIIYSGKGLEAIGTLVYFRHVRKLDLSDNNLSSIDIGPFSATIEELDLSHNNLTGISFSGTKILRTIDISNNKISSCTGLSGMDLSKTLETVNASNNCLMSFECAYAGKLKNVNLSNNELSKCDLEYCGAIADLNLSHNHLTEETTSFVRPYTLKSLVAVDLSYNDFVRMESDRTWTTEWKNLVSFASNGCAKLQELDLSPIEGIKVVEVKDCPRLQVLYLNVASNPKVTKDETTQIKRK